MTSTHSHDVAIVGLGAMGGAAALELSRRGLDVVGFDRYAPPHAWGSSHGDTRIIREAYFEDPVYVPMVQRAFECWRELERLAGTALLQPTGGVMIGLPGSSLVEGSRRSAELHGLPCEMMSADQIRARFPALQPEPGMVGIWEPRAGVLRAEACVTAQLEQARRHGADLHFDEPALRWQARHDGISVVTERGSYHAGHLIISAGPWVGSLLPGMPLPFRVERQVLHWFEPASDAELLAAERCPVHLWQFDGERFFYGFPTSAAGVKVAFHYGGETTTAEEVRREVAQAEVDDVRAALRRFVPAANGRHRSSAVCLYTNMPDGHFLIDHHPQWKNVLVASPCSGHGFKFAPVIGEILADFVQGKPPRFDLTRFRWR
jgi:sarcosine oxidase